MVTQEKWEQGSDIHYFYNIDEMMEVYENLVAERFIHMDYLPIACDSFGNEILLCLNKDKDYGCIFFANHETENPNETFWNISFVAASFDKFINASLIEII